MKSQVRVIFGSVFISVEGLENEKNPILDSAFLFIICFVNLSVSSQISTHVSDLQRFQVGVLRTDGTIVPFAEYRNRIWWNPWPENIEIDPNNGIPSKSLSGHPEPWFQSCVVTSCTWYFWPSSDTRRILSSRKVVQVENHSDNNWALLTAMSDAVADKDGAHHKNIGLALSADLKLEGMKAIDIAGKEATYAAAFIKPTFISLENAEIDRNLAIRESKEYYEKTGFPISKADRSKVELELTKLSRTSSSIDGRNLYYFQIEKKYTRPEGLPDWQCHHISELSGWLLKEKDGSFNLTNESFWITDCDKKGGGSIELSSILRLDNRAFVFTVDHVYDSEIYVIFELEDFGLKRLLETSGG